MKKQEKQAEAGFSLIEVLVALVIFAVGILGLAVMQLSAIRGNTLANQVTEATVFASDQIEQIMFWDYDDNRLNATNNNAAYILDGNNHTADGHQADAEGHYAAYWEVTDNSPQADSKTVDVTVVWQHKGTQKSLSISTVKAR